MVIDETGGLHGVRDLHPLLAVVKSVRQKAFGQELFQGIITCIHADFRIGGLAPGETKRVRGVLYVMPNDIDALLKRYQAYFLGGRRALVRFRLGISSLQCFRNRVQERLSFERLGEGV